MISAKIVADSINAKTSDRLTTFIVKFPRFVNSELLRHRNFSFCSASSRAIPSKKLILSVVNDPAIPVFWGKNQSGMQSYEELPDDDQINIYDIGGYVGGGITCSSKKAAETRWFEARDTIIKYAESLLSIGLHKQIANRILEPWQNITVLVTGTEWENFFALRAHPAAQPEIRDLAYLMLEIYNKSEPVVMTPLDDYGSNIDFSAARADCLDLEVFTKDLDWHMPFSDKMPEGLTKFEQLKVSIARIARLSYDTFDGEINVEKDFMIYEKLLGSSPIHASPAESVAFPIQSSRFVGNLRGWFQFRKLLTEEASTDTRIVKHKVVDGKLY